MKSRAIVAGIAALALTTIVTGQVSAIPGGRIDLRDTPTRTVDTRTGVDAGKVVDIEVGTGVLQIWVVQPDSAGTAVIHPCDEPAPTDRISYRLDPAQPTQYVRVFASEDSCVTSTEPVHVIVDNGGPVAPTSTLDGDQYVALPAPFEMATQVIDGNTTLVIPRPAQLTAEATAAIVGVEVIQNDADGFVSTFGCDGTRSFLADLSFDRGRIANVAAVAIEPGEDICVYASASVALRLTLMGELRADGPTPEALPPSWSFVPGAVPAPSLRPINPVRVLDTRRGIGAPASPLSADDVFELSFGDLVSPLTTAVSMNATAANAAFDGFLTVWPCDGGRPDASNLNFTTAGAVPNLVVSSLTPTGTVCMSANSDVDVIVDVNGTYEADGGLHAVPLEPERILDTRNSVGTAIRGRIAADNEIELQVTGGDIASDAGAATLNVTAAGSDENGFVTVYPCGSPRPTASNLNFRAGEATPNLVTTPLSPTGTVCLYTTQAVHLIADLASWYGLEQPAGLVDLAPTRVLDTREPIGVSAAGTATPSRIIELDFALAPSVATDADAVVMNVTAAQAEGVGFVTVWPCDQTQPTVSNLNIRPARTVANLTTVKLSASGTVCIATTSSTHLIADVAGYLTEVPVAGNELVLGS